MIQKYLHDNWVMKQRGTCQEYPAKVPGSVYNDLLLNHQMEDPYYRDNELKALELIDHDYEYRTVFSVEEQFFEMDDVVLRFEGLDTVADIYLNGSRLGSVNNMHRQWEFRVMSLLKAQGNKLEIVFHSPTRYIRERYAQDPVEGSEEAMTGFPQLRKAHCMFGWDWGPRLPDAGIWRPVSLLGIQKGRFASVYVKQAHQEGTVSLSVEACIKKAGQELECSLREAGEASCQPVLRRRLRCSQ